MKASSNKYFSYIPETLFEIHYEGIQSDILLGRVYMGNPDITAPEAVWKSIPAFEVCFLPLLITCSVTLATQPAGLFFPL